MTAEASCSEKKTQKTGEKTKPVFKRLFQATLGTKARKYPRTLKKKAAKESVAATKPAKRLRSKTTPEEIEISPRLEEAEKQKAPAGYL